MNQLKEKLINLYKIFFLFTIITFFNCKNDTQLQKDTDKKSNFKNKILLKEQDFFKCSKAKDTVFKNEDYIKYIPIDSEFYSIKIKMKETIDTLDYSLNCNTHKGMIPKVLLNLERNYICLGQGSSSYRYLTLCSLNDELKKIDVSKYETSRDVTSNYDGFVFLLKDSIFFYELNEKILYSKKISNNLLDLKIKESKLYKNEIVITSNLGKSFIFNIKEFNKLK